MLDFDVPSAPHDPERAPLHFVGLKIVKGLVVPEGSVVRTGSTYALSVPSLEKTQAAFKQFMGIKKKRVVQDDESEKSVKKDASDDDDSIGDLSEASEESEPVESDND